MASLLNLPNCGGTAGTFNSGVPLCDVLRTTPKALIMLDAGVSFTPTQMGSISAFVTALRTGTRAARGARVYPIKNLSNYTDNTTAPTKGAVGNLSIQQITLQEGVPSFTFQHYVGEIFHQQLTAAENAGLTMMILDDKYHLFATLLSNGNITGFTPAEFYVEPPKFATASTVATYPFSITLNDITEIKENLAFLQLDATVLNISGNINVNLTLVAQATNTGKFAAVGGGKNLGDLYATQLAATAAWVAFNTQTLAAVTVTGVAYDSTLKTFNVTVNNTDYSALTTGQTISVSLASPLTLSGLGVDGFDSPVPGLIVKP